MGDRVDRLATPVPLILFSIAFAFLLLSLVLREPGRRLRESVRNPQQRRGGHETRPKLESRSGSRAIGSLPARGCGPPIWTQDL